jgi:hypothetical protein
MPARGYAHPVQEAIAYAKAVDSGFRSREGVTHLLDTSVFEVDFQNALDKASAEERGLLYSIYPELAKKAEQGRMATTTLAEEIMKPRWLRVWKTSLGSGRVSRMAKC